MKRTLLSLLLLIMATTMSGQTLLYGDLNHDGKIDVADVTALVNVAVGRASAEAVDLYVDDNTAVLGTWYRADGTSVTFRQDGTTDYPGGSTYKYMYLLRWLQVYDSQGTLVKTMKLREAPRQYLLEENEDGTTTRYINSAYMVTSIELDKTSLAMNSGTTTQLEATLTPSNAFEKSVVWTSSDESVATVSSSGEVTAVAGGSCTITCTALDGSGKSATCSVNVTQMVTSITLSHTNLKLNMEGSNMQTLTATVLPSNAANTNVDWASSNTSVAMISTYGLVIANGLGTCTITCTAKDGSGVVATCVVTVKLLHEYVDLGLPSGTLWATCNIGAENPEDYGDHFAWGETVPYGKEDISNVHNNSTTGNYTKSIFSWGTYKYCVDTSNKTLTKYCQQSNYGYNGFTDNLTELEPEDDAAYANWGSHWRMPSKEQFDELVNSDYTTRSWTTLNGVYGRKITSKTNGNSIFLPAAGYCKDAELKSTGGFGFYWSRTFDTQNPNWAYYLYLSSVSLYSDYDGRCVGHSVRPVRASQ